MKKQIFIICFLINFFSTSISLAAPQINEFSSSTSDDWIEIYNPDSMAIDLSNFKLRDSTENNQLDLSGVLAPQGFIIFDWANKLNNGGDIIRLVQVSDNLSVDQVTYGNQGGLIAPGIDQSAGRLTDGGSVWTIFTTSSKNSSNNSSAIFTPPTPTPSKTPTPTKSPPTPKPVTNSATKSPSIVKSVSTASMVSRFPTRFSSNLDNSGKIARTFEGNSFIGIRNVSEAPQTSNKTEVLGATDRKMPVIIIFGGILLIFAGVLAFSLKYINIEEIYEKIFNK